ncbi:G-type lectin S-receptor-like serine/threonine-protein kinase LECRK2 [Humulus lupulus]|uniref:G-type lectin S-receptor-like serine/threonine-protein kinase LECRK2 n=1 Tax=Humulus lupulus TaxID=3486 RepID=UPI002B40DA6C|nr:G-type lectin S-receptor-like serine/threonine-protein kinase LECRK2 [Humulus lupulus]
MAFLKSVRVILLAPLFVTLVFVNVEAQTSHSKSNIIKLGSSLGANLSCNIIHDHKNISSTRLTSSCWFSPYGHFAFGFYPQGHGFAVGIWIVNQTDQTTIVWTANRDYPPLSSTATLKLTRKGMLLKEDSAMNESKVITRLRGSVNARSSDVERTTTSAALLDSGSFVLYSNHSIIWDSFDFPTDTILGGQNLSMDRELVSSISTTNQSSGKFRLFLKYDGNINLGLFPVNTSETLGNAYWVPAPAGRIYYKLSLNFDGALFLTGSSTDEDMVFVNGSSSSSSAEGNRVENGSVIYRATLDDDGVFRLYSHHSYNVSQKNNIMSTFLVEWSALDDKCKVKGVCGFNSYCRLQEKKTECYCYPGFAFINPKMRSIGCYREFTRDGCKTEKDNGEPASSMISSYNITPFENMWWDDSDPYSEVLMEKKACSNSCLADCNYWAALHTGDYCRKCKFPLKYGKRDPSTSATAFLKMVHLGNYSLKAPVAMNSTDLTEARKSTILIILGSSLSSIAFLCLLLAISGFLLYKQRVHSYNKLLMENSKLAFAEDFGLQVFSYNELERATEGFKDELGRGLFGAVYRGNLLYGGQNKAIAVKRLEKFVEDGIREFRAEMSAIGMTHHRNLVQLLGFCIEDSKVLLVCEFMSNGSLADLLFKAAKQPSWRDRVRLIQEVAKGVLYLHEECAVHIIHGNLNSQNILLNESWTAKISDFGFARLLLMPSQLKMSKALVEERASYSAPEWQKNAVISVKADVFSFGVVLLETICFKRNIDLKVSEEEEMVLYHWVYNCYKAGELLKLVEGERNIDVRTLERLVRVGLWCTQDDPDLRPLMKNVILMLEGTVDVPPPPT